MEVCDLHWKLREGKPFGERARPAVLKIEVTDVLTGIVAHVSVCNGCAGAYTISALGDLSRIGVAVDAKV